MKKYSVPRQVFRAVNMPALYLIMQFAIAFAVSFVYSFVYSFNQASQGITDLDAMQEALNEFAVKSMMPSLLISTLISGLIFILIFRKESRDYPRYNAGFSWRMTALTIILGSAFSLLISALLTYTRITEYFPSYEGVDEMLSTGSFAMRLITVGIAAPVVEELCMRGLVYNRLKSGKMPVVLAMVISSLIFGVIHLNLVQGLYAFVLGMVIVLIYEKFRTLWAPVLFHVAFNTFSQFLSLAGEIDDTIFLIMFIASIILIGIITYLLIRKFKTPEEITDIAPDTNPG